MSTKQLHALSVLRGLDCKRRKHEVSPRQHDEIWIHSFLARGRHDAPLWEVELPCTLHQGVLVQLILHHELRQISDHLAAGRDLHTSSVYSRQERNALSQR